MRKIFVVLGVAASWMLFSGLIGLEIPLAPFHLPTPPPSLMEPSLLPDAASPQPSKNSESVFLPDLESRLQGERLLATSA